MSVSNDVKASKVARVSNGKSKTDDVMAEQNNVITQKLIGQLDELNEEKEWLREMLEAKEKQLNDQQRRFDEQGSQHAEERKTWSQQLDAVQKLLPAPEDLKPRKKLFGLF